MSALLAAASDGFEAPTTADFWQPLVGDGAWALTRGSVVILLSVGILSAWLLLATRRLTVVPSRGQYLTEQTYGLVRNSVARDIIGSRDFLRFVPMLFTMFVLILLNNLFGVIPPVQFPTMSRIGFPAALALVVFVVYHVVGIRRMGVAGYFKHMIPQGVPGWVLILLVPLELITYFFTRPVTLALRLFGNMFAGHLLLVLFTLGGEYLLLEADQVLYKPVGVVALLLAIAISFLELLVQFLQAYVFTLLTAMYVQGALAEEH